MLRLLARAACLAVLLLAAVSPALAQTAPLGINQGALEELAPAANPPAANPQASLAPAAAAAAPARRPKLIRPRHPAAPAISAVPAKPAAKPHPPRPGKFSPKRPPPKPLPILELLFQPDATTLPAGDLAPFCAAGKEDVIVIGARAPSAHDDPSAARRLSLQRALAVRDALVACGVPSPHILPRAMGSAPGADPNATYVTIAGGGR